MLQRFAASLRGRVFTPFAAAVLTASHLPWNRNGMKFFTPQGGLGKKDIAALVDLACAADEAAGGAPPPSPEHKPAVTQFLPVYAAQLVELIRKGVAHPTRYDTPLEGMKVVVDAGNGSGGFFADLVLQPLGADTAGSQFLDPDGHFPNHIPNPEDPGAVASASAAVRRAHADLGVIFDTDVDRSAIVDAAGSAINRNRLIALLSAVVLRDRPGATIVTDSVTSDGLTAFIEAAGGKARVLCGRPRHFARSHRVASDTPPPFVSLVPNSTCGTSAATRTSSTRGWSWRLRGSTRRS